MSIFPALVYDRNRRSFTKREFNVGLQTKRGRWSQQERTERIETLIVRWWQKETTQGKNKNDESDTSRPSGLRQYYT